MRAPGVGARSMLSRRLRAQCQFGGRSCGARLLCACGGEVWYQRAHRWEELCRLLAHLVGGDLLAWLRCFVLLVRLTGSAGELSFAFALFRRKFKNKLILPPIKEVIKGNCDNAIILGISSAT